MDWSTLSSNTLLSSALWSLVTVTVSRDLGPVGNTQNLVCFAKKSVTGSHFYCERFVFHRPKFSQLSPNFKDAVENIWRPTFFCQAAEFVVSWQLAFVGSSSFANMAFLVIRKISLVSDANTVEKEKVITNFFANVKLYFSSYCEQGLRFLIPLIHSQNRTVKLFYNFS